MSIPRRLWSLRRERPVFVGLSVLTALTLLVWPLVDAALRSRGLVTPFGFNDYGVYSGTVVRWLDGGEVYVQAEGGGYHGSYLYPPITLLAFYPLTFFDFQTAAILLGGGSLLLLWIGLLATSRVLGYRLRPWEGLLALPALFGFHPALRDFKWAQIATLLTALLCFAFYAQERGASEDRRGRAFRYASGALTTLGSAFKLFFATSGAHLLREKRRFAGAMGTALLLLVASIAVFGVETHLTYVEVLRWGKGWGSARAPYLWDASAAYHPLHVLGGLAMPAKVLGVLGVVGLVLASRHAEGPEVRRTTFALGVAVIPLFAPSADAHDLVVALLPAIVLLAGELRRADGYPAVPVLAVLLFHLHRYVVTLVVSAPDWASSGRLLYDHAGWLQPGAWATVLLVGLAAYRLLPHASWAALDPRKVLPSRVR